MTWEVKLFARTRLGAYQNCLDLIDAYSDFAPWWERVLLAFYAGVGSPLARCLGSNTRNLWKHSDAVVRDLLAVSGMSPNEIAKGLIEQAGLAVSSVEAKWHVSYGDDRKHIFAVAKARRESALDAKPVYSFSLPQISSAASSGILSS